MTAACLLQPGSVCVFLQSSLCHLCVLPESVHLPVKQQLPFASSGSGRTECVGWRSSSSSPRVSSDHLSGADFCSGVFVVCSKQNEVVDETPLHHAASLTAASQSRRPRGRSAPSLWLFECCGAAPRFTHNPFNDRPLRYYCSAAVGAARRGKQHQRD